MMDTEATIKHASYLLEDQKKRLLEEIGPASIDSEAAAKLLDTVLFRLCSISLRDLSPSERMEINFVLKDLGYGSLPDNF